MKSFFEIDPKLPRKIYEALSGWNRCEFQACWDACVDDMVLEMRRAREGRHSEGFTAVVVTLEHWADIAGVAT